MRIIVVNQKVAFVRHWFRWYRVQRGGVDWRRIEIKPYFKEKSIDDITKNLQTRFPTKLPPILSEELADREVAKNSSISKSAHKKRAV